MKNTIKKKLTTVFQSAQDSWPEDEAGQVFSTYRNFEENGLTLEEVREMLKKDSARMEGILMRESDGQELVSRFRLEMEKLCKQAGLIL